jgi:hypothetical protein
MVSASAKSCFASVSCETLQEENSRAPAGKNNFLQNVSLLPFAKLSEIFSALWERFRFLKKRNFPRVAGSEP